MSALERAKQLAERAGKSRALRLAPLAMAMVISAHAGVLGVDSAACLDGNFSGGNAVGSLSSSPLPMQVNGVQGFKGFGQCGLLGDPFQGMGAIAVWNGTGVDFSGGSPVVVPIDYEFSFLGYAEFNYVSWQLGFYVDEDLVGSTDGIDSMYSPISGSFNVSLPGEFSEFALVLQFFGYYEDSFRISSDAPELGLFLEEGDLESAALYVDIPQNSIDVNRAANTQVPEPGMFVLAGSGLLALAAWRKARG